MIGAIATFAHGEKQEEATTLGGRFMVRHSSFGKAAFLLEPARRFQFPFSWQSPDSKVFERNWD
jgi:hypothetical protein